MNINYTITKEDYVEYFAYMFWDMKGRKKQRIKNAFKQLLYVILFCSILFFTSSLGSNGKYILLSIIFLFIITLLPLISGRSDLESQAKEITNDPENESIFLETNLTITDDYFFVTNKLTDTKYNWKAFTNKIENANHYYLFENAMQAIIIPKRAFKNNEEKMLFNKILSRNLSLDAELKDVIA